MSFRRWLNVGTAVIVAAMLYFSRHELVNAWHLLGKVDLYILALIIPAQLLSYYAAGAMMFSYLKKRGDLKKTPNFEAARMALELNFVNHILPSGGVSGVSYMTWRLSKLGVPGGRAALAQVVRYAASFLAYLILLIIAVLLITIDGNIQRFTILISSAIASTIIFVTLFIMYVIGSESRMESFSRTFNRWISTVWHVWFRRSKPLVKPKKVKEFFSELHHDYAALRKDPAVLKRAIAWAFVFNIAEVAMFFLTFLSFGVVVNPASILIALGIGSIIGMFLVTPGGAGGYEAVMILFLASAGVSQGTAVAGVLLARTVLIILTIATGYYFYHRALSQYGKHPDQR